MVEKLLGAASLDSRRSIVDETLQVMATTSPATIAAALPGMAGRVEATPTEQRRRIDSSRTPQQAVATATA